MNCRTLEYIVAVKETGSIRQAARECNVAVGTISGQITRLENYLGVKIFKSRAQPAELDEMAADLFEKIDTVVENLRMIKLLAAEAKPR
jgi:DNA-binding transcriptional LysR family regulator